MDNCTEDFPELAHIHNAEDKRLLLERDQVSLSTFLSPDRNQFGVRLKILEPIWNFRLSRIPPGMDVIIHHADRYKVTPEAAKQFLMQKFAKHGRPSSHEDD
jgi:hypothetical protein